MRTTIQQRRELRDEASATGAGPLDTIIMPADTLRDLIDDVDESEIELGSLRRRMLEVIDAYERLSEKAARDAVECVEVQRKLKLCSEELGRLRRCLADAYEG